MSAPVNSGMANSDRGAAGLGWVAAGSDPDAMVTTGALPGVIEAFVRGKRPDRPCEDVVVVTPDFAAVIDGMSSPLAQSTDQASGRDFAGTVADTITKLPADVDGHDAIGRITAALRSLRPRHAGPVGAVAAVYSRRSRQLWRVGDVDVRVGSTVNYGRKRIDTTMADFRAAVNLGLLRQGASVDTIRDADPGLAATAPLLHVQSAFANQAGEFGYGVLDGQPVPDDRIDIFELSVDDIVTIVSDGYPGPSVNLSLAEQNLADLVASDPLAVGSLKDMAKTLQPGAEAPDDRAYLRFRVEGSP